MVIILNCPLCESNKYVGRSADYPDLFVCGECLIRFDGKGEHIEKLLGCGGSVNVTLWELNQLKRSHEPVDKSNGHDAGAMV